MTAYRRRFTLQAAHFNGQREYALYSRLASCSVEELHELLRGIHGHNFDVEVACTGELSGPWLVDDEALTALVTAWDNVNLSVLPEFSTTRATTENMATVLASHLAQRWPTMHWTVFVHETPHISASASASATAKAPA